MLEVDGTEEEVRDQQGRGDQHEERAREDRSPGEHPQVHQRGPGRSFDGGEGRVRRRRAEERQQGGGVRPAAVARFDQAVDEGRGARGDQQRAGEVEACVLRDAGRNEGGEGAHQEQSDGHVDVEDPLPAGSVGQRSAEEYARRGAGAADRRPDAQGLVAFGAVEAGGDQGQGGRGQQGRADALADPAAEQRRGVLGQAGDQ